MGFNLSEHDDRQKALSRYRSLFRAVMGVFAVGVLLTAAGVIQTVSTLETTIFGAGLLLVSVSGLNAYKIVTSTVRIMEMDAGDGGRWATLH